MICVAGFGRKRKIPTDSYLSARRLIMQKKSKLNEISNFYSNITKLIIKNLTIVWIF